jgi:hypothetical protein
LHVRSGITLIGTDDIHAVPLFAGIATLQGTGEVTGLVIILYFKPPVVSKPTSTDRAHVITDVGQLNTPIALTGSTNVGAVHNGMNPPAVYERLRHAYFFPKSNPPRRTSGSVREDAIVSAHYSASRVRDV